MRKSVPAPTEAGLTRNQMVQELARSTHGKLEAYVPTATRAAAEDPEFLGHLIAWNEKNGQVRDSKVALPVVYLAKRKEDDAELLDNALAHMALLDPRNLVRSIHFAHDLKTPGAGLKIRRMVERYLRAREANWAWWERTAVQHRGSLKTLYAMNHIKPNAMADLIVMKGKKPTGTVFEAISQLKTMSPLEAAGTIITRKIPFLIALGALGEKAKDENLVLALIERMTPTELVTNTKMLERMGVKDKPALRSAFEEGLKRAAASKKATLKTTRAAESIDDEKLKAKLEVLQEKQLETMGGVEGNWLVLGDKSGSMESCIETARHIAGLLAKMVKGQVHLVFFDVTPTYYPVTGKTYDEIKKTTARVGANGATSIGCGLMSMLDRGIEVDGIAIVSDAEENTNPLFSKTYKLYSERFGKQVPVYLYKVGHSPAALQQMRSVYGLYANMGVDTLTPSMAADGFDMQTFQLGDDVDYYSLPNLVKTMRTQRYGLSDEVMATPLLTLDAVFA